MAGIVSYGAYIPLWRLGKETKDWGAPAERSVANFDEDSITMAVAAAVDTLAGRKREDVDALYFASTSSPYKEKQASAIVAAAADLRHDLLTMDFTDSLRAGTLALRAALDAVQAGSAKQVLVVAADARMGGPRGDFEANLGDGAAAFIVGKEGVIAEVEGSQSVTSEILDVWRAEGDPFVRSWEDRFVLQQGYFNSVPQAVTALLKKQNLTIKDFAKVIVYSPDGRRHTEMARILGVDAKTQLQDAYFGKVGNTGAAHAMMQLVGALQAAKPGQRFLLANYGDGADAFVLKTTEAVAQANSHRGVVKLLDSKKFVSDYQSYLKWRGVLATESASRRPPILTPSPAALFRESRQILRLHGVKCNACGTVQFPPQRVCTKCHAKDNFTEVRLSDKKGTLFTYSMDYIAGTMDVPLVITVVNFEGGGRVLNTMTDRDISEVRIGMPVEMSFRKLYTAGGIHNYFWKSMPIRA